VPVTRAWCLVIKGGGCCSRPELGLPARWIGNFRIVIVELMSLLSLRYAEQLLCAMMAYSICLPACTPFFRAGCTKHQTDRTHGNHVRFVLSRSVGRPLVPIKVPNSMAS